MRVYTVLDGFVEITLIGKTDLSSLNIDKIKLYEYLLYIDGYTSMFFFSKRSLGKIFFHAQLSQAWNFKCSHV